jgi:large subunit ribosomal protein L3
MKFIIGKKIGMTQIFNKEGKVFPVTLIQAKDCVVTQVKTKEKDGYSAVQLGLEKIENSQKVKKSQKTKPFRFLREIRVKEDDLANLKVGQEIKVSNFKEGDIVKISAISKGKGFQGAVKRWGFSGLGASHGVRHHERTIGSVGSRFPQRVLKGKKMPGHMGVKRVTIKNLEIVKIDPEEQIIALKGAVPGSRNNIVEILGD